MSVSYCNLAFYSSHFFLTFNLILDCKISFRVIVYLMTSFFFIEAHPGCLFLINCCNMILRAHLIFIKTETSPCTDNFIHADLCGRFLGPRENWKGKNRISGYSPSCIVHLSMALWENLLFADM